MIRSTFSDDTTSGRWSTELRGPRRVTIVARAEDDASFDWLASFKSEFLPAGAEAKSTNVLPILDLQPRARQLVLRKVEGYSIFIVDLHEYRRSLLGDLAVRLRPLIPPGLDPYEFALQLPHVGSNARQFLRQMVISESVLGRLEALLEWTSNPFAQEMRREGLEPFASTRAVHLLSRTALERMDDGQLATFLARLGSAVGDALSPERQAAAILELFEHRRYFAGGYFAYRVLSGELEMDRVYDTGPLPVRLQLEAAHQSICDYVDREIHFRLGGLVQRGIIEERVSHTVLGLQAADIAAALAGREYESAANGEAGARARAVKRLFARVLLNGHWV